MVAIPYNAGKIPKLVDAKKVPWPHPDSIMGTLKVKLTPSLSPDPKP
jgi:hypothetical protein